MEFTGERFLPGCGVDITFEHYHRYSFIKDLVNGKKVLDLACGEGYGSFLLAGWATEVVGVDVNAEVIERAKEKYINNNLKFKNINCLNLSDEFPEESFNVVTFFEALEHINCEEQKIVIKQIKRILKKDGILIISSPNKNLVKEIGNPDNEFHLCELTLEEFQDLLNRFFKKMFFLAQRFESASFIWPIKQSLNYSDTLWQIMSSSNVHSKFPEKEAGLFYVAICMNIENPDFSLNSGILLNSELCNYSSGSRDQAIKINLLQKNIDEMYNSNSWRITAPMRWFMEKIKGMKCGK